MRFAVFIVFAATLWAQSPTRVEFRCTDDDLQQIGLACSEKEPCAVFLELSAIESLGPKLFLTGNLHADTATLYSILLASEDGGQTWTEAHPRIRNGSLEHIQFLDFEAGWISGQLLQGVPRDAFLLITRDGGKSWRRAPVVEDEGRTGTIERFWFDSRTSGMLVLDRVRGAENNARHELYESMTGGDNWSLREASSKPVQLKRAKPVINTDWRLRADSGSKSYRLERKQGTSWTALATFPIRVGECVVKEPVFLDQEPEPEPEPEPEALPPAPVKPKKRPTLEKKRPVR
jgi:photosystem II stability/assembly factor-like uncharacterized protein